MDVTKRNNQRKALVFEGLLVLKETEQTSLWRPGRFEFVKDRVNKQLPRLGERISKTGF